MPLQQAQSVRVGDKIYLSAVSSHGKKLLQDNGASWVVIDKKEKVLGLGSKPGILLESLLTKAWVWLRLEKDRDFNFNVMRERRK